MDPNESILKTTGDKATAPGNEDHHYCGAIEPIDFIESQDMGFHEANVIKYVARYRRKGGLQDLYKAAWYLARLITKVERIGE